MWKQTDVITVVEVFGEECHGHPPGLEPEYRGREAGAGKSQLPHPSKIMGRKFNPGGLHFRLQIQSEILPRHSMRHFMPSYVTLITAIIFFGMHVPDPLPLHAAESFLKIDEPRLEL